MSNVPDDWGCYYYKCQGCGARCHESEGGCGCPESEILESERPGLQDNGYEWCSGEWKKHISTKTHVAKKNHNDPGTPFSKIMRLGQVSCNRVFPGDTYKCESYRYIDDKTGEQRHERIKTRTKKGPHWSTEAGESDEQESSGDCNT